MTDEQLAEDESHYEISLTAGQAFVAFVLLLLSLAASFAFGLLIGKGQTDERLAVKHDPAVITEGSALAGGKIVESTGAAKRKTDTAPSAVDSSATAPLIDEVPVAAAQAPTAAVVMKEPPAATPAGKIATPGATTSAAPARTASASDSKAPKSATDTKTAAKAPGPKPAAPAGPAYAQLMSTADQKAAEALAARLIDKGFTSAYVERGTTDKGPMFRVRVKFSSEAEARAAEPKLKEFSRDVWITRQE
jgi:hypothetical protein